MNIEYGQQMAYQCKKITCPVFVDIEDDDGWYDLGEDDDESSEDDQ